MEEHSVSGSDAPKTRLKKDFIREWRALASFLMKRVLKFAIWVTFIAWLAVWFLYPSTKFEDFFVKLLKIGGGTFYGILGGVFALFNAPLLIIIFLAIIYLAAFPREYHETQQPKSLWFRLWTFPVLTHGPLGVVSASEFIGILVFAAYILWAFSAYTVENHRKISKMSLPSKEKSYLMLEKTALRLASIGLTCMEFLYLPITRGSVLLRLIDIPVEHATRYHVWLGHAMMTIFTSHGLCYMVSWTLQGHLLQKIVKWNCNDFSYLAGLLTLLTGLLIWVTSLHRVRVRHFELFYYTHQLYALFILFLALHIGDSLISVATGGIFFFLVDRFLRFCQSRKAVSILSATTLPCGTVELVLSKPANLHYNALSFIFLRVPEISRMQWHPFSVSSSPLDGNHHLSVLIKVLGGWTGELSNLVTNISHQPHKSLQLQSNPHIMASVEGPYGHDFAYHLTYKNLILIAGGIGMSPFLAILRDILHRIRENKPCSPTNVLVIWSVKTSKELSLLSLVDADSICPSFSMKLKLEIQTYVTQEFSPALEDGNHLYKRSMNNPSCHMANKRSMSNLVGTGNNILSGVYVIISTVGFAVLVGLMQAFYITPSHVSCWWFKGLLFILCMTASVVLFGGPMIMLWHLWKRKFSGQGESICGNEGSKCTRNGESNIQTREYPPDLARSLATTQYGCRPNFRAIFNSASNGLGKVDVGVIVCGPPSLQSSVAAECRSRWTHTAFHLHIHSFDL